MATREELEEMVDENGPSIAFLAGHWKDVGGKLDDLAFLVAKMSLAELKATWPEFGECSIAGSTTDDGAPVCIVAHPRQGFNFPPAPVADQFPVMAYDAPHREIFWRGHFRPGEN